MKTHRAPIFRGFSISHVDGRAEDRKASYRQSIENIRQIDIARLPTSSTETHSSQMLIPTHTVRINVLRGAGCSFYVAFP